MARNVLVNEGVAEVKVLTLSNQLGVSRSSFYWYFKSRKQLLQALLDDWEQRNTQSIVNACDKSADSIGEAACNFFAAFLDADMFHCGLDFAVREWARRDKTVRTRIDVADKTRLNAITVMFARHGFSDYDAEIRARIIYYMQLGYHALDVREPMEERMNRLEGYLRGFTGEEPSPDLLAQYRRFAFAQDTNSES
ncbi:MAG: TetR/AcrR family transcriptional regulator [Pseudomonadota bacterium]